MTNSQADDLEAQLARYAAFLASDPENITLLLMVGGLNHQLGKFELAEEQYRRVLDLDSSQSAAISQLANVYISMHRFADAEELLRSLGDELSNEAALQYNLGMTLYYQEKFADALGEFQSASADGVSSPEGLAYQAQCLHHQGEFEEALVLATESMQQAPGERIQSYVALLQMDNGDLETADRLARGVLDEHPDNVDANIVAGTYALQRQEVAEALRFLNTSIEGEPTNARSWQGLGLVKMYEQNFAGAIDAFKQSLDYTPRNAGTWVTLGWAYIGHGDLILSEEAFRHAVEVDRNFGEAHGGLAVALAFAKREDEARAAIKKARGLNKGGFGAVFAQTILMEARGQRDRAVRLLGEAFKRSPTEDSMSIIEAIEIFSRRQSAKRGPTRLLEPK